MHWFSIYIESGEERATSRHLQQRPPLRLHWFDHEEPKWNDDEGSDQPDNEDTWNPQKVQAFASAAELLCAVHSFAAAVDIDVTLSEDERCVLFDCG